MKKVLLAMVSALLICSVALTAYAVTEYIEAEVVDYGITLNGEEISLNSTMVTINDRTYLPLRELCNILGVEINWSEEESKIEISTDAKNENIQEGLTLTDFSFVKLDMDLSEVFEKVGEPSYYTGSGLMWGVFELEDGTKLHLHDYMTDQVKKVSLELEDGTRIFIDFNEDGMLDIQ